MSTVKADTVQAKDFATDLTLGASGDTVTVTADSINVNKVQDKGGNTLWDYSTGEFVSTQPVFASQNLKWLSTAVASGSSSVSFISGIDSTYDVYIFKFFDVNPATNDSHFLVNFSTDGGSNYNMTKTTTSFLAYNGESGGFGLTYQSGNDLAQSTAGQRLAVSAGSGADESSAGTLWLFNPSNTTYVKHFYSTVNSYFQGNESYNWYMAGYINSTSDVDAVEFKMDSGNMDGVIKMYGVG